MFLTCLQVILCLTTCKAKGRLYSECLHSAVLNGSTTWPIKEEDVIRLERNDLMILRWMCNVSFQDKISAEELRIRLKLKSIRECL